MTVDPPASASTLEEPMPFRRLIDEAGALSRQHFKSLFLPIAIPFAIAQVLSATAQVTSMGRMGDIMGSLSEGDPSAFIPLVGITCVVVIVMMIFYALAAGAMLAGTANATAGRPIGFSSHWGHAFKPKVLGTVLLIGFFIGLGWMCCLVPGIIMAVLWGFALSATVEDKEYGFGAISRAYQLSGYNPQRKLATHPRFKTFVLLIVGWLLSTLVSLLLQLPLQLFQQFMITRDSIASPEAAFTSKWLWLSVPNSALASFGSSAVLLYMGFGLALLYWDVRRRAEGGDLEAEMEALNVPRFRPTEPTA